MAACVLTAPELYRLMEPVFEVWPELRPQDLHDLSSPGVAGVSFSVNDRVATALCIAAMVEGLIDSDHGPSLFRCVNANREVVSQSASILFGTRYRLFTAPTLVEALAAACIAFKGAQEVSDGQ